MIYSIFNIEYLIIYFLLDIIKKTFLQNKFHDKQYQLNNF